MSRRTDPRTDVTVVIVSFNDGHWLERCLTSVFARAGRATVDVVVVDNGSDGAHRLVRTRFPAVRVLVTENHGFAHGNNVAIEHGTGRYVLFLNPDTELVDGTLHELVAALDERPEVGLAGARQVTPDGALWPTIRYFPGFTRALGDALGSERWPRRPRWAGERELDLSLYERETECDWTSGSFMLARREAIVSAGLFDERFFLYSEEPDLCLRIKRAGWKVTHLPWMTIVHHAGKGGTRPKMVAQDAFTRRQYAHKHFGASHRLAYLAAVGSGHLLRVATHPPSRRPESHEAARLALRTLVGRAGPPFGTPPQTAYAGAVRAHGVPRTDSVVMWSGRVASPGPGDPGETGMGLRSVQNRPALP
jgi:N-acetylglucosaminyl-diphospho-decaprenol L-rhamnosyltransferase